MMFNFTVEDFINAIRTHVTHEAIMKFPLGKALVYGFIVSLILLVALTGEDVALAIKNL